MRQTQQRRLWLARKSFSIEFAQIVRQDITQEMAENNIEEIQAEYRHIECDRARQERREKRKF
jgi:hypothetical protein